MKKSFLFFKQSIVLFVFSLISFAVCAQETNPDLVFSGNKTTTPQYPGGEDAMNKFIEENLVYPESALKDNISGRVFVRFLVDTTGISKGATVQQGLTPDCNLAALEVIAKMPKWLPATRDNKKTTGFVTVPVVFKTKQVYYEFQESEEAGEVDYDQYQLLSKKWYLVELSNKDLPDNLPTTPYFIISQNDKRRKVLNGNASCADFMGMYSWNPKNWSLKFTVKEITKKKCKSKKVKVIDGEFLALLKATTQYRVADGQLTIGKMVKEVFTPLAVFEYELLPEKGKKK